MAGTPLSGVKNPFAKGSVMLDVYESATDEAGRFGAVFESDDETAYFYLLDMGKPLGEGIISAFSVKSASELLAGTQVSIRWSPSGAAVGLFVDGALSAIFDLRSAVPTGRWASSEDDRLFAAH